MRIAVLLILAVPAAATAAKAADQKLLLKDGTDQLVKSYEVTGDRVRYYSAEREEWEEIPTDLVDWDATDQAKKEAEKLPAKIAAEAEAAKDKSDPRRMLAPGITLPDNDGAYAFDGKVLLVLTQSEAVIADDIKLKILSMATPLPVLKAHAWIMLPGASSGQSVAEPDMAIYLQVSNPAQDGYALVRVQPKEDKRVVGEISMNAITRSAAESRHIVPSMIEQIIPAENSKSAVMRLSPKAPLEPGEYAVVEFVAKDKQNLMVWDFRYSPKSAKTP